MRIALAWTITAIALTTARFAREGAESQSTGDSLQPPYTPSPTAARIGAAGYNEAVADLMYVRLRGYVGEYYDVEAPAVASLTEAIVALDPQFKRAYEFGANAMTMMPKGVDNSIFLRAVAVLERGAKEFPRDWSMPLLAGQIYIQDLKTDDAAQRRHWDERGVSLVESAIRKPNAPQKAAVWAAHIRTKLGQVERAAAGIRELLLTTKDASIRSALLERLAKLEKSNAAELAAEILESRQRFDRQWRADRYSVNASMYVLLGARIHPGFDLSDLATGGRELVFQDAVERLAPPPEP